MGDEKMCIGVDTDQKTGDDRLMVRIGNTVHEDLLYFPGCRERASRASPFSSIPNASTPKAALIFG